MEVKVIGSTKVGYNLPTNEAIDFAGKSAGICYMPEDLQTLFSEDSKKTERRAKQTLVSGHHSVFDHPTYNLALSGIPKILAMILNNEGMYTTSEKSARYTKMEPSEEEKELYEKWIEKFEAKIKEVYPEMADKQTRKLAQENARGLISIFTPATTMEYTVSFRQLNYIVNWFKDYINNEPDTGFSKQLKPYLKEFVESVSYLIVPELNSDVKERRLSIFDTSKEHIEYFGEVYSTTYLGTFSQFAQAQRHRTLQYRISIPEEQVFYVPLIIRNTELEEEWLKDISFLAEFYPQGMLIRINERGTVENFVLKCKERLCGCAQLEIMLQTKEIMDKYVEQTKDTYQEIYEYLKPYSNGVRCTFKGWKCSSPCIWGAKNSMTRLI